MTDKITLPMDVSKGVNFDFLVEGITEEQAKNLLGLILDGVENYGGTMGGGYYSVKDGVDWDASQVADLPDYDLYDLLDLVDDDISLDDIEDWENDWDGIPDDLSDYEY